MIPHFHAAGHLPYAKSARLYLQQMNSIAKVMPPEEYTLFSAKGYFTIRRATEFWSGNFSDQTIEQFLMRMLKTSGGMTHGRGITDSTLTKWVHALPHCLPLCDALEKSLVCTLLPLNNTKIFVHPLRLQTRKTTKSSSSGCRHIHHLQVINLIV